MLSKIGCQTSCYYHRKKASKLPASARTKGLSSQHQSVFGGALSLSTCLTPNLPHFPNGSVPTVSLESKAFPFAFWFVGTANGRVVFRILQKQTEIGLDSSEICRFLLQGLFILFFSFLRLILRSFIWATNNITK